MTASSKGIPSPQRAVQQQVSHSVRLQTTHMQIIIIQYGYKCSKNLNAPTKIQYATIKEKNGH